MVQSKIPDWFDQGVFLQFVLNVRDGTSPPGAELSLVEFFDLFKHAKPKLTDLIWVEDRLFEQRILVTPPVDEGDNLTKRLFKVISKATPDAFEEIRKGESSKQEFKSSINFDRKRAVNDPEAKKSDLASNDVLFSAMKSIAGFINSKGGLLWIGVSDFKSQLSGDSKADFLSESSELFPGISSDCAIWNLEDNDFDSFELRVRNQIDSWFWNGSSVNHSVDISFPEICGVPVCRMEVYKRVELVFLRDKHSKDRFNLWVRQGVRTLEIKIHEFEKYLENRN